MTIGNALFSQLAIRDFDRMRTEISGLQARISSGRNDPRPSSDPLRAAQLSAARDQQGVLATFTSNAENAATRLSLTDVAIGEMGSLMRDLHEVSIRAASDSLAPESITALRAEVLALRDALLVAANTTDANGQPLFAGFSPAPAFEWQGETVAYAGDAGTPVARVSESSVLRAGVSGEDLLMRVDTDQGPQGVFDMIDDLVATLSVPLITARTSANLRGEVELDLAATRAGGTIAFTLTGRTGSARIEAPLVADAPGAVVDAVNAQSAQTGISARLSDDGRRVVLDGGLGAVGLSDLSSTANTRQPVARLTPVVNGQPETGQAIDLRNAAISGDRMVGRFSDAIDHLAEKRGDAGALAAQMDRQLDTLSSRELVLKEAIARLDDLDVAAAVTRLQTLLLNEQAAQQSFVKITQSSLFDYLR